MTISITEANTEPTTPSVEEAWLSIFPRAKARDGQPRFGGQLSSETSSFREHPLRFASSTALWVHLSPTAYEEPDERADTQKDVWETLRSALESSTPLLSIGTKILQLEPSEPSSPFRWIDVNEGHFASEILSAIEAEPVEDGCWHPAEELLRLSLVQHSRETILWLRSIISRESNASVVASVLKCLGRVGLEMCSDWGFDLASTAIEHPDVEVRDAAVQVLEIWGTGKAIRLLRNHWRQEQTPWLRSYIESVVRDWEEH